MIKIKTNTSADIQFQSDTNTRRTSRPPPVKEQRLDSKASTDRPAVSKDAKAIDEENTREAARLLNLLASIVGVEASDLPAQYLRANPHILMGLDGRAMSMDSALARRDLKHELLTIIDSANAAQADAMSQRYRGKIIVSKDGHRSSVQVEHEQSEMNGKSIYPKTMSYKNLTSGVNMKLIDFAGVKASKWQDNIGSPKDCNIAGELFTDLSAYRSNVDTVADLCTSLKIDYYFRPDSYVVVALQNKGKRKQLICLHFDQFVSASTSKFYCAAEEGDEIRFLTTPLSSETDAIHAISEISSDQAPDYFKFTDSLMGVFI